MAMKKSRYLEPRTHGYSITGISRTLVLFIRKNRLMVSMPLRLSLSVSPLKYKYHVTRDYPTFVIYNIVTCLRSWPLMTTKRDVLAYWRRRSDCYFVLSTISLVVTTITFKMWRELGWLRLHFRVDSLSWLVLLLLASWLLLWSLVYLISLFASDRLLWSSLVTIYYHQVHQYRGCGNDTRPFIIELSSVVLLCNGSSENM
jgi:hypothetical protein